MAIKMDNSLFRKAIEEQNKGASKAKIAALADSSFTTLEKILNGGTDLNLATLDRLGEQVQLDVEVRFVKKAKTKAPAAV